MDFRKKIEAAQIGSMIPVYKEVDIDSNCPVELFAKLSDYGRQENSILLESADIMKRFGEKSLGSANPCLLVKGKGAEFSITALNKTGERFLGFIKDNFGFCDSIDFTGKELSGKLVSTKKTVSEEEHLKLKTHADILRTIAFAFTPTEKPFVPYSGLFGAISYDFIDQFEQLPASKADPLEDPDYEMVFLDNLFLADHEKGKIFFIANALKTEENSEKLYSDCIKTIEDYEAKLNAELPSRPMPKPSKLKISSDTSQEEFEEIVSKMKQHIVDGDVFQAVPSRTTIVKYSCSELDIYRELRRLNPSPYMFFFRNTGGVLLGSSPETFLKVEGDKEKTIEIRPIAGTRPRGIVDGKIDNSLDEKMEEELRNDTKELAEHTMLVDLARNDVARVSIPGSRKVDKPHFVERYSHVMHLVSSVTGTLKPELDALHAYLASMNMGTLTGAPKIKAMELIRKYENTARGFYGGSVGYLTPSDDFDSCIVIRSMRLKGNKAYIRAGAGIVYDSIPEKEFIETENKAKAPLAALEKAQEAGSK
ncbi:MAG: anthranilate synthase component 1 [Candidatus Diapherotrites archaeon]|uniref:anthranilate synthase n=1 Tax=Candidatus Iainarchaeum sp. TaxID=3101447 RepID=A0A2D6M170_9ARCH|nr:anthranilate synthase component 1 [Candidatus Diapherotrites archaeon]